MQKSEYPLLYELEYKALKSTLLQNGMIYIGAFIEDEFVFYSKEPYKANKIVVLAEGED